MVVGANDTLRAAFAIERVAAALDRAHGALSADGAVVLTACLPDPGRMLGLPAPLARPLARRMRAVNTVVHAVSARYQGVHLHLAEHPWVAERASWSVDRLHPAERGHRLLARGFHTALAAAACGRRTAARAHPRRSAADPRRIRPVDGDPRHPLGRRPLYGSAARSARPGASGVPATVWPDPGGCWTTRPSGPPAVRSPPWPNRTVTRRGKPLRR